VVRHHGFVGRLPEAAWAGQHTLAVLAVNRAPNARRENATQILIRSQKVCDGVTCGPTGRAEEEEEVGGELVLDGDDGVSAPWGHAQMMRAIL
jgi:hypothetical protein